MPEYLAPGVYVEEVSYRSKSIEGVSTSTAGFVGPTRFGPTGGQPEVITSFAAFERIYGGAEQLAYGDDKVHNFVAQGVRAFFSEGGSRLYISRVYEEKEGADGIAYVELGETGKGLRLQARYPGLMGNMRVTFNLRLGLNILVGIPKDPGKPEGDKINLLKGVSHLDVVWVHKDKEKTGTFYQVVRTRDANNQPTFKLVGADDKTEVMLADQVPGTDMIHVVTLNVAVAVMGSRGAPIAETAWQNLACDPNHDQAMTRTFAEEPASRATELYVPLVIKKPAINAVQIIDLMLAQKSPGGQVLKDVLTEKGDQVGETALTFQVMLDHGGDGVRPTAGAYEGKDDNGRKSGLLTFEDVDDISIVAAPGSTYKYEEATYQLQADTIQRSLIGHCERMRYRVAVLDSAEGHLVGEVRNYRAKLDSTHAALYYPWIRVLDPVTQREVNMPPSGFVAGIYARNDTTVGVHKAPANEVIRSAIGLQLLLNKGQQDVLNPEGINCFRYFEGRGNRLWGARTISSDPEWKYVNLRRYFCYLERSIDKGTQWVVFMNNDENLWANVRSTISDFLFSEWRQAHLMGTTPDQAYFVRCDQTTMTQNDLDNGRLVVEIGVSPVRPAEFVIFRIGQWTASK